MANDSATNAEIHTKECVVLIADDDATARLIESDFLMQAGFTVAEAGDGPQALAVFKQKKPDIVLLDVMMPEMSGFEVCASIRSLPGGENTAIMTVTGLGYLESIHRAYEAGATDFITKPINWVILVQRVRYLWRAISAREELRRSEEKNRALINAIPDLMLQIGKDGTILDFKAPKDFDLSAFPEDLLGKNMSEVFFTDAPDEAMIAIERLLKTGETQVLEYQVKCGIETHSYASRIVVSGEDELLAIVRDVTESKKR